jgi:hypothetical protein
VLQQNAPRKREFRNNRTELWEFLRLSAAPAARMPGRNVPANGEAAKYRLLRYPNTRGTGTRPAGCGVWDRLRAKINQSAVFWITRDRVKFG